MSLFWQPASHGRPPPPPLVAQAEEIDESFFGARHWPISLMRPARIQTAPLPLTRQEMQRSSPPPQWACTIEIHFTSRGPSL